MSEIAIERDEGRGKGYVLRTACVVPCPLDDVFPFFADPSNLELLTPAWLKFRILTPQPIQMHAGTEMEYRIRVHGIPLRWHSTISSWSPPHQFIDEALRSPYRYWHHEHRFESVDGGTRVSDLVHYDVPGGRLLHWLTVGRDLRAIFRYRRKIMAERYGPCTG